MNVMSWKIVAAIVAALAVLAALISAMTHRAASDPLGPRAGQMDEATLKGRSGTYVPGDNGNYSFDAAKAKTLDTGTPAASPKSSSGSSYKPGDNGSYSFNAGNRSH